MVRHRPAGPGRRANPRSRQSPHGYHCPQALYQQLLRALTRLDSYLRAPLDHELAQEPHLRESHRRFLDGDQFTLADCSLLPKLHIVDTVCAHFRQLPIPAELSCVRRYLDSALQKKEFKYTCPHSAEILAAYQPAVHPR